MTTQEIADGLKTPNKWSSKDLTYSFYSDKVPYSDLYHSLFGAEISEALKNATHKVFDYVESILDITFTYTDGVGDIVIASEDMDEYFGYTYLPEMDMFKYQGEKNLSGDIFINSYFTDTDYEIGNVGWATLVHELGHSLGLEHPFKDGYYQDIDINDTVMSYNSFVGYDEFNKYNYFTDTFSTYQSADMLALQSLYGKNETVSNDIYNLNDILFSKEKESYFSYYETIKDGIYTIYDPYGINSIDMSDITSFNQQFLDISSQKESVIINGDIHHYLSFTSDTIIQNITASKGNDTLVLNDENNVVDGDVGEDTVYITNTSSSRIDKFYNGDIIVSNYSSGFDTLKNIEKLYINGELINTNDFLRDVIIVDDYDSSKTIDRLYLTAFNRLADANELNHWTNDYMQNSDLNSIANTFINSNEFISLYGEEQSDEQYIEQLYKNVLSREADANGEAHWLNLLQSDTFSKEDVLISIASSQEAIELTDIYFESSMIDIFW